MVDRQDVMDIVIKVGLYCIKAIKFFLGSDCFLIKGIFYFNILPTFVCGFSFYETPVVICILFSRVELPRAFKALWICALRFWRKKSLYLRE